MFIQVSERYIMKYVCSKCLKPTNLPENFGGCNCPEENDDDPNPF